MLDEKEFLSPFGIRAISRIHQEHPYVYHAGDQEYRVSYLPGIRTTACSAAIRTGAARSGCRSTCSSCGRCCSTTSTTGTHSRSNARPDPAKQMNLYQVAEEIARRLSSIFLKDAQGQRPVHGATQKFQQDPALAGLPVILRILPRGHAAPGSARATRPDGPERLHASCIYSHPWTLKTCWSKKRTPPSALPNRTRTRAADG